MEILYKTWELWNKLPESQIWKHISLPHITFANLQPAACIDLVSCHSFCCSSGHFLESNMSLRVALGRDIFQKEIDCFVWIECISFRGLKAPITLFVVCSVCSSLISALYFKSKFWLVIILHISRLPVLYFVILRLLASLFNLLSLFCWSSHRSSSC